MNRLHNVCPFWLIVLAFASGISVAALKSKPAPEFPDQGATLDISDWSFRKSVSISNSGPQQFELDLDVLSNARLDFADLRLMRQGEQIPYLLGPSVIQRFFTPEVVLTNDPQHPTVSRWKIHLPRAHLSVSELRCDSATPWFEREITIFGTLDDAGRGDEYSQPLAHQTWTKTPGSAAKQFARALNPAPLSDTLILEVNNGDNPPIQLDHFKIGYTTMRILFEAKAGEELFLYYGNASVAAPHYDLNLVSNQLRSVDKSVAALGAEETLKYSSRATAATGKGGAVFWAILALVVVALLVVIARLLPKSDVQPPK